MKFVEILRRAEKLTVDNSPMILTALGVTGTITTAILTGKAAMRATELLYKEDAKRAQRGEEVFERKEIVGLVWKLYIPPATSGVVTIACIVGANRIGHRRAAAMALAYSISERAFDEYKNKVIERFGTAKEQTVRDDVAADRVRKHPVGETVVVAGGGNVLCFDHFSGRYFESDMQAIKKAVNDINYRILHSQYASLTDFYSLIGLSATSFSEEVGWNSDHLLELLYSTVMSDDDRPCIAIDFAPTPVRSYYRCWAE